MYLFIDTSYFVFYKMYATLAWFSFSKTEVTEEELVKRYTKSFLKEVESLKKKYPKAKMIFAKDTPRETIWRKELLPTYKSCRDDIVHEHGKLLFAHTYKNLLNDFDLLKVRNAEADDIIAVAHNAIRRKGKDDPVVIVTNDNDLLQLYDENTTIINLKNVSLADRWAKKYGEESLKHIATIKALAGDKSDSVTSIVGLKTAIKLAMGEESLLKKKLEKKDVRAKYELNKKLVDFDMILPELRQKIEVEFEKMI